MSCSCSSTPCGCAAIEVPIGPVGPAGPEGPVGPGATVAVGDVTSGSPAAVVNVGTPSAAVFDFTIPTGAQGDPGTPGTPGSNSWSTTSASFIQPAVAATVDVDVVDVSWVIPAEMVFIAGGGSYQVVAINGNTLTLLNIGGQGNQNPGVLVSTTAKIGPSGKQGPAGENGTNGAAGSAGAPGHTPVLRSGAGYPADALGVDGDWYFRQLNNGRADFYTRGGGTYAYVGSVLANRAIGYGSVDPNTLGLTTQNTNDQYYTFDGTTWTQWYWNGITWVSFASIVASTGGGTSWAFNVGKSVSQPLIASGYTTINFDDESGSGYFDNGGNWTLFQYVVPAGGLTGRKFVLENLTVSRLTTGTGATLQPQIILNGNTGSPLAINTALLLSTSATSTTQAVLETAVQNFTAGDIITVQVNNLGIWTNLSVDPGCRFYIQ